MSFSSEIKNELCNVRELSASEMSAMLYGLMFAGRTMNRKPVIQTENANLISAAKTLSESVFSGAKTETTRLVRNGSSLYTFSVKSALVKELYGDFSVINTQIVSGNDLDGGAFLRGVFVSCGSITDPKKEYHLEIVLPESGLCPENQRCKILAEFICEHGMEIKTTTRAGNTVIYIKESGLIEDFLTYIGAGMHAIEIMQVKIEKDLRNRANRSVNCECANLDKTVAASEKSRRDIEFIIEKNAMSALSAELRETAELRLANPESSLSELCEMFDPPISRSGLNHRLRRLSKVAKNLRNE